MKKELIFITNSKLDFNQNKAVNYFFQIYPFCIQLYPIAKVGDFM